MIKINNWVHSEIWKCAHCKEEFKMVGNGLLDVDITLLIKRCLPSYRGCHHDLFCVKQKTETNFIIKVTI